MSDLGENPNKAQLHVHLFTVIQIKNLVNCLSLNMTKFDSVMS